MKDEASNESKSAPEENFLGCDDEISGQPGSKAAAKKASEVAPKKANKAAPGVKSTGMVVFSIVFLLICARPFLGLVADSEQMSSDGDSLSEVPSLVQSDGSINLEFLSEAGSYFEDHFALRNQAIDLNAHLRVDLFSTSPTDQVIVGEEGWLFYGGTLADYQGTDPLEEREIVNIVHNLELMQGYVEAQGAAFTFVVAPNKNSLYPEHMPYYLPQGEDDSMERLLQALDEKGVNYVDLFTLFDEQSTELYYKTDTHWTPEGAFLVTNALLAAASKEEAELSSEPKPEAVTGDIELMLYPISAGEEQSLALETGAWHYMGDTGNETSVEDESIDTAGEGQGTLLMYRDSFANTLVPLLAPEFESSHFSKLVPYNLAEVKSLQASTVIVERAERHIDLIGEEAPFVLAPSVPLDAGLEALDTQDSESDSSIEWYQDGDFRVVEGWVDESLMTDESNVYIEVDGPSIEKKVYVPFYVSSESAPSESTQYGYRFYLDERSLTDGSYTLRVLVQDGTKYSAQHVTDLTLQR